MHNPQTSENVVWVPDYEDIDLVEVEADLRRQEERRYPKKAEEERLKEAARRTEVARIASERQESERKAEEERVEAQRMAELQELRQAEQRAMAESHEAARRLEESRSAELEQAKAEVERAKAEAQRAVGIAYQSQPLFIDSPPLKSAISAQTPPWGNGFGSFQNTKSVKDEPIISPLFASEINLSPTPQGGATPPNNPPIAQEPIKRKPLLGAAFGGDNSSAS
jgi:hypothetical protein